MDTGWAPSAVPTGTSWVQERIDLIRNWTLREVVAA
jgi:hypothetical protein